MKMFPTMDLIKNMSRRLSIDNTPFSYYSNMKKGFSIGDFNTKDFGGKLAYPLVFINLISLIMASPLIAKSNFPLGLTIPVLSFKEIIASLSIHTKI